MLGGADWCFFNKRPASFSFLSHARFHWPGADERREEPGEEKGRSEAVKTKRKPSEAMRKQECWTSCPSGTFQAHKPGAMLRHIGWTLMVMVQSAQGGGAMGRARETGGGEGKRKREATKRSDAENKTHKRLAVRDASALNTKHLPCTSMLERGKAGSHRHTRRHTQTHTEKVHIRQRHIHTHAHNESRQCSSLRPASPPPPHARPVAASLPVSG